VPIDHSGTPPVEQTSEGARWFSSVVASAITALTSAFAAFIISIDMEQEWLSGVAVDW
jgi:hypothetical protein